MRMFGVFVKTAKEIRRDPLIVLLTLIFAPAFVLLYYVVFPELSPSFSVTIVDLDRGYAQSNTKTPTAGQGILRALVELRDGEGRPILKVTTAHSYEAGRSALERHDVAAMLIIPPDFSDQILTLGETGKPANVSLWGDLTHPGYTTTAALTDSVIREYVGNVSGEKGPISTTEHSIGGSGARSDFEIYIPGLIVFSVILLIFLAAMTVTREIESGAMRRLRLTRMTAIDYLAGTSGIIVAVGIIAALLTLATAYACGFRSQGPVWCAVLVLVLTIMSVIGVGMMVAAVSRSVSMAFVIANFPLGLLMFFTGAMLPMPRVTWFTIIGHSVGPFEILAPTHAVTALNKIFTLGSDASDILFELAALTVLTAGYFAGGVALLHRAQRRAIG